jgi:hypothetical protein
MKTSSLFSGFSKPLALRFLLPAVSLAVALAVLPALMPIRADAADFRVTGCEVFIDKAVVEVVATLSPERPIFYTRVYLKLDVNKFPEDTLSKVGWLGTRTTVYGNGSRKREENVSLALKQFDSHTADYFEHDLNALTFDDSVPGLTPAVRYEYEGVYFVETHAWDRFWLNESYRPFAAFSFSESFESQLRAAQQVIGPVGIGSIPSLADAKRTTDFFPGLNPNRCK